MITRDAKGEFMLRRCGVSQATTPHWTLREDLDAYAAGGWEGIGIWLQKLEAGRMERFVFPEATIPSAVVKRSVAEIRSSGLRVTHVVCAGLFTDPDDEARARRIDHAVKAAYIAAELEAACLIVIPGNLYGCGFTNTFARACTSLETILERTAEIPVPIAIEPVSEVDFANTLSQALDLIDAVARPRLGVYLDTFHLGFNLDVEQIARAGRHILGVHAADKASEADPRRLVPGDGHLPLQDMIAAIEATGYPGTYDLELLGEPAWSQDPQELLRRSGRQLAQLIPSAG